MMKIQANSRLLLIGDSITDCGRKRPIGEGRFHDALGTGYVSLVDAALGIAYAERAIHTINMGVSGNTVRELKARWERDVLDLRPDWLSIMIGINDVWLHFRPPGWAKEAVPRDEYAETLDGLIRQVEGRLKGLILMTPYFLETDRCDPMRVKMDQFSAIVRELAAQHGAILVDTQRAFDRLLEHIPAAELAEDSVHVVGHMLLARIFLQSIEYEWSC